MSFAKTLIISYASCTINFLILLLFHVPMVNVEAHHVE